MSRRAGRGPIVPALLVGLLSFAITVEWRAQTVSARAVEGRRAHLAAAVADRQARSADLERRLSDLRAQIAAAAGTSAISELRLLSEQLGIAAGTTRVSGPGVVVTLTDAAASDRSASTADSRIQDVDLQSIVNALWINGAEAIAVNSERIVATTAIRNAGQTILVNYRVLSSPYVVSAVGAPGLADGFRASDVAHRFHGWQEIYGLGFKVVQRAPVELPAYGGSVKVRYASTTSEG